MDTFALDKVEAARACRLATWLLGLALPMRLRNSLLQRLKHTYLTLMLLSRRLNCWMMLLRWLLISVVLSLLALKGQSRIVIFLRRRLLDTRADQLILRERLLTLDVNSTF